MTRTVVVLRGTRVFLLSIQGEKYEVVARGVGAEVAVPREGAEVVVLREDAEVAVPGGCVELVAPREDAEVAALEGVDGNMRIINL